MIQGPPQLVMTGEGAEGFIQCQLVLTKRIHPPEWTQSRLCHYPVLLATICQASQTHFLESAGPQLLGTWLKANEGYCGEMQLHSELILRDTQRDS